MIILGNRAETHAELFELGSTLRENCLVLQNPGAHCEEKNKIGQNSCAIDGSKQATKALGYVSVIARKFNSKVTLLHVAGLNSRIWSLKQLEALAQKILWDAAIEIKGIEIDKKLEFGSPAESIIRLARQEDYDLIVLGSRGLTSVKSICWTA